MKAAKAPAADFVSPDPGPVAKDGDPDLAFTLSVDGPVASLGVLVVDAKGEPIPPGQWDTLVDEQVIPKGWKAPWGSGSQTYQLGVVENGKLLNGPKGELAKPLGPGHHELTLYIGGKTTAAEHHVIVGERPDHTMLKSNIVPP